MRWLRTAGSLQRDDRGEHEKRANHGLLCVPAVWAAAASTVGRGTIDCIEFLCSCPESGPVRRALPDETIGNVRCSTAHAELHRSDNRVVEIFTPSTESHRTAHAVTVRCVLPRIPVRTPHVPARAHPNRARLASSSPTHFETIALSLN